MSDTQTKFEKKGTPTFRGRLARRMVLLLVPATILPVIFMGWLLTPKAQRSLQREVTEQLLKAETGMAANLTEWLLAKSSRLSAVDHRQDFVEAMHLLAVRSHVSPDFAKAQQTVAKEIASINERASIFDDFIIVDASYAILASSEPSWVGLQIPQSELAQLLARISNMPPPATAPPIQVAVSNGTVFQPNNLQSVHFFAPSPIPNETYRHYLFTVLPHVDEKSGKQMFIVGISEEVAIENLLAELAERYPDTTSYILFYDGTYLALTPQTHTLGIFSLPDIFKKPFPAQGDPIITGIYSSPLTQKRVFSIAQWLPELNAAIGLELPASIFTQRSREILPTALELLALTVILLTLIIWLIAQRISQPILEVADTARRFAEGDWQMRLSVKRHDEIGLLAYTFNQMANELVKFYRSLEERIDEHTAQIRAASEVAALATSATDLDEILRRTANLIVEHFEEYYHASIFLTNEHGYAVLEASTGPVGEQMKKNRHKLKVGGQSLVGWATQNRRPRVASDVTEDAVHFKNPLLPETRAEAAIPIVIGNQVLGALDVQSKSPHTFDEQHIATLQTLANQLAAAIYNARLREEAEIGHEEIQTLYQLSRRMVGASETQDIITISIEGLQTIPYIGALYLYNQQTDTYEMVFAHHPQRGKLEIDAPPLDSDAARQYLLNRNTPLVFNDVRTTPTGGPLAHFAQSLGCTSAAYLAISTPEQPVAIVMIGSEEAGALSTARLQPYLTIAEIASAAYERVMALSVAKRRLKEFQTLVRLAQAIGVADTAEDFYQILHREISQIFGEIGILVALYDPLRRQIEIPYARDQNKETVLRVPPFPMGEGLISRVITTRRPLRIVENTAQRAKELGAKLIGEPAKSWLGVPLVVGDQIIGVLTLQDMEREKRFGEEEVEFVSAIAISVALLLHKMRLVSHTESVYEQERLLFQINQQSQTADVNMVLETAIRGLQRTLRARRGVIRLHPRHDGNGNDASEGETA